MLHVDELKRLSSYYKDIISAMSQQSGKHFVDLGQTLRYGLTLDLGLFIDDVKSLMYSDRLILKIERMSPKAVSDILTKSDDQEEDTEEQKEEQEEIKVVDPERKTASTRFCFVSVLSSAPLTSCTSRQGLNLFLRIGVSTRNLLS